MPGGIFVIQGDGTLVDLREESYDSEAVLQALLAEYPNLWSATRWNPASRGVGCS